MGCIYSTVLWIWWWSSIFLLLRLDFACGLSRKLPKTAMNSEFLRRAQQASQLEDDFDISYNAESTTESNLSVLILKLSSTHEFRRKRDTIGVSSFPTTDLAVISSSLPPDVVKQYSAMKLRKFFKIFFLFSFF